MEFIFIIGILIAVIGAVTIAAVIWQSDSPASARPPAEATSSVVDDAAADPTSAAAPQPSPVSAVAEALASLLEPKPSAETLVNDDSVTIETVTALYAHANDDVAVPENALKINVSMVLANRIESLYAEYLQLDEERTRLAEALLTNMLFEKIERTAGRLEIATERETLDLRERFTKVSADYDRVQFRLGSLQHLNARLSDPRMVQQLDELVLEIKRLAANGTNRA
jgi:hypothetical protein